MHGQYRKIYKENFNFREENPSKNKKEDILVYEETECNKYELLT